MKEKGISEHLLKTFAVVCMLLDHIGYIFFESPSPISNIGFGYSFDIILRGIGRMAFPIFLFCLIEGYSHTHDKIRYAKRLFLFAILSEIPFDFGLSDKFFYFNMNNVIWTLVLIVVMYIFFDKIKAKQENKFAYYVLVFSLTCILAYAGHVDYGFSAICAATALYFMRGHRMRSYITAILCLTVFSNAVEILSIFSVPLIYMYNGERGKQHKYFFYVFYPAHLIVLRLVYMLIF